MAAKYIIGKAELLTYSIDAPKKKPNDKAHPYSLSEAKEYLLPQINSANEVFAHLPGDACFDDFAVAKLVLHPSYIAKSYFPEVLLNQAGLSSLGSRTTRIAPRKKVKVKSPDFVETTELLVAGTRRSLRDFVPLIESMTDDLVLSKQFAQIESFQPMTFDDRIKENLSGVQGVYEVGLHFPPDGDIDRMKSAFKSYASSYGFDVKSDFEFRVGHMLFVAVESIGLEFDLQRLALFTLMRVLRPMPKLRSALPLVRSNPLAISFSLPKAEPLSKEPKVAILDGGLPEHHPLGSYIRRYFKADDKVEDVAEYTNHGLAVTSAFLFGPIEPNGAAHRPFSLVDHHRVLDSSSDDEDPYELYKTLGHVEAILLSRHYQFINLSLGPDLAMEDQDVHSWTSVIDTLLSDGNTLMTVAVGNNGDRDALTGLNRIQVPSDSVNALSVGSADKLDGDWNRSHYSAIGPGRSPGRRKPDLVAFGGVPKDYFHVAASSKAPTVSATLGTSFAAPLALRSAVGVRAILGDAVHPLTTKALLINSCTFDDKRHDKSHVGWGRVPFDVKEIITCKDGEARIIYQGELRPGKYLRAPIPLPKGELDGSVRLKATFCYASPVDPQDASAYTKAGLDITFRPFEGKKKKSTQKHDDTKVFFKSAEFHTEAELRADLGKWETVLHAENNFFGSSLQNPVFDIHYNARDSAGAAVSGAAPIRYALVITVFSSKNPRIYEEILSAYSKLEALEPQISVDNLGV